MLSRSSTLLSLSFAASLACNDASQTAGESGSAPDPVVTVDRDTKSSPNAGARASAAADAGTAASPGMTGSTASENKAVAGAAASSGAAGAGGKAAPSAAAAAGSGGMSAARAAGAAGAGRGGTAAAAAGSGGMSAASAAGAAGLAGTGGVSQPAAGSDATMDPAAPEAGNGGASSEAGSGGAGSAAEPVAGAGGEAAAGSGGEAAGGAGGANSEPPACSGPPGLYAGTTCSELAPGVEPFQPQYPLFTDDGQGHAVLKSRWIYLPPGSSIDTSNPNRWTFPVGSVFFKQFRDPKTGLRIETRRLAKVTEAPGFASWTTESYAWSSDQLSVSLAPEGGVPNAMGSGYDIPSTTQCKQCHQLVGTTNVDAPIGFNAIQLNHDLGGLDLATLLLRGTLQNESDRANPNVSLDNAVVPGDATQRAGIGYLHGNCGHCHGGPSPHGHQLLWTPVGTPNVTDLPMFGAGQTGVVCHCLDLWRGHSTDAGAYRYRIDPGSGSTSGIIGRLSVSALEKPHDAMPPLGRKGTDSAGIERVKAFIASLDGSACAANPPDCSF